MTDSVPFLKCARDFDPPLCFVLMSVGDTVPFTLPVLFPALVGPGALSVFFRSADFAKHDCIYLTVVIDISRPDSVLFVQSVA